MLPGILKRMQCKREAATDNPMKDSHHRNSRISVHADGLPKYTGSTFTKDWTKKKSYAWQAHLQRIAHYLVPRKGVWWHFTQSGDVCFSDGDSDLEYHSAGPQLLHFRNSNLEDVSERAKSCWQSCVTKQLEMPIDAVRIYNGDGNLVNVVTAPQEMDTSFNASVVCDVHFPLVSTPGNVQNDVESGPEIPATSTPLPTQSEAVPLSEPDAGVCADMAVEVPNNPMCELKMSVCKAIAKLLGLSSELREFDTVGHVAKSTERPLPIQLKKHKKWLYTFVDSFIHTRHPLRNCCLIFYMILLII